MRKWITFNLLLRQNAPYSFTINSKDSNIFITMTNYEVLCEQLMSITIAKKKKISHQHLVEH